MTPRARLLLASAGVSYAGSAIAALVTSAVFARAAGGAGRFSLFFLALALPPIVLRRPLGAVVARYGAPRVLVVAELGRALVALAYAGALAAGAAQPVTTLVALALAATLSTAFVAAFFIALPRLVAAREVATFAGRASSAGQAGWALGAGVFLALSGRVPDAALVALDAVTFAASALAFLGAMRGVADDGGAEDRGADHAVAGDGAAAASIPLLAGAPPWLVQLAVAVPFIALAAFNQIEAVVPLALASFGAAGMSALAMACSLGILVAGLALPVAPAAWRVSSAAFVGALAAAALALATLSAGRSSLALAVAASAIFGAAYTFLAATARAALYATARARGSIARGVLGAASLEASGEIALALALPSLLRAPALAASVVVLLFVAFAALLARPRTPHPGDLRC